MTRRCLSQIVGAYNEADIGNISKILCADGERRYLYRCSNGWLDVVKAVNAILEFNLQLEVFQQEDGEDPKRFDLWKKSVRKKAKTGATRRKLKKR